MRRCGGAGSITYNGESLPDAFAMQSICFALRRETSVGASRRFGVRGRPGIELVIELGIELGIREGRVSTFGGLHFVGSAVFARWYGAREEAKSPSEDPIRGGCECEEYP